MFRHDHFFKLGWFYLIFMFIAANILPEWVGNENGLIENLQLLWVFEGLFYCWHCYQLKFVNWGGSAKAFWLAGCIYFFLIFMREISWGRTYLINPDGSLIQYSQMGLYGQLVHPIVAVLILTTLILLYQARLFKLLKLVKIPAKSFSLLLIFIFFSYVGEKLNWWFFNGQVAEELAEFGAYMMMFLILRDMGDRLCLTSTDVNCSVKNTTLQLGTLLCLAGNGFC